MAGGLNSSWSRKGANLTLGVIFASGEVWDLVLGLGYRCWVEKVWVWVWDAVLGFGSTRPSGLGLGFWFGLIRFWDWVGKFLGLGNMKGYKVGMGIWFRVWAMKYQHSRSYMDRIVRKGAIVRACHDPHGPYMIFVPKNVDREVNIGSFFQNLDLAIEA